MTTSTPAQNPPSKTNPYTLISIPFSHYVEKVRILLDLYQLPYYDYSYLPGAHICGVYLNTLFSKGWNPKKESSSSKYSVPILKQGSTIISQDSRDIGMILGRQNKQKLDLHVDEPAVQEWDELFTNKLGVLTRPIAYTAVLADPSGALFTNLTWKHKRGLIEYGILRGFVSIGLVNAMKKKFRIDTLEKADKIYTKLEDILNKVEKELSDGRAFLTGDELSMADVTLAALGCIVIGVKQEEGNTADLPSIEELQELSNRVQGDDKKSIDRFVAFCQKWRASRTGQLILKVLSIRKEQPCARLNKLPYASSL